VPRAFGTGERRVALWMWRAAATVAGGPSRVKSQHAAEIFDVGPGGFE
jgi:hypothetical protein